MRRRRSANCVEDRGECCGAVLERVDVKNAIDVYVCAAEESGDNGLIELDEDGKEQFLGCGLPDVQNAAKEMCTKMASPTQEGCKRLKKAARCLKGVERMTWGDVG